MGISPPPTTTMQVCTGGGISRLFQISLDRKELTVVSAQILTNTESLLTCLKTAVFKHSHDSCSFHKGAAIGGEGQKTLNNTTIFVQNIIS